MGVPPGGIRLHAQMPRPSTSQSAPRPTPSTGSQPTSQPSGTATGSTEPQFIQMLRTMLQSGSVSPIIYINLERKIVHCEPPSPRQDCICALDIHYLHSVKSRSMYSMVELQRLLLYVSLRCSVGCTSDW